jgi:hypothetical protein
MVKLTEAQQFERRLILEAISRLGGTARWSQLHSRGLHFMQVHACANRGDTEALGPYEWRITEDGRRALEDGGAE